MGRSWLASVLVVALVIIAIVVVLRLVRGHLTHPAAPLPPVMGAMQAPRQILDERYAKGDLTTEEYLAHIPRYLAPPDRSGQAATRSGHSHIPLGGI